MRPIRPCSYLRPRQRRAARGFTLIELVIAMACLAIIAAIAVPSYTSYVRRSARVEVQALITTAAKRQSQFLVDRRRYADSITVLGLSVPDSLHGKYTVAVTAADGPPPTFTITATAAGNQAKDKCPSLSLDQAGQRTPATCW